MKRRFLSILLCLLLTVQLLPAIALAADEGETPAAVELEAGGVSISGTADAPAYAATDSEGVVTLVTESDPWNIRWDGRTLTLKNAVIHSDGAFGISLNFHSKSDVAIELEGTNQVSSAAWENGILGGFYSCGVWLYSSAASAAGSTVTIRETETRGSLTATGGLVASSDNSSGFGYSAGIGVAAAYVNSDSSEYGLSLTLESGTVTAQGGTEAANSGSSVTISAGVYLYDSVFTITGGSADLADGSTAEAGSPCFIGAGIYADGRSAFCMKAGALTASGKNGERFNYGICDAGGRLVVDLDGGRAEISGDNYGIGAYFWASDSAMISISITGGDITLEGGESVYYKAQAQIKPNFGQYIEVMSGASKADATTVADSPFMQESQVDFSGVQYARLSAQDLSSPTIANPDSYHIPAGIVGTSYRSKQPLSARDGEAPYTFSISSPVEGLSIDEENYLVYQRPDTPQAAKTVTITVTDKNNMTDSIQILIGKVEPLYTLTVVNGSDPNNAGSYEEGARVWIWANEYDGKRFLRWVSDADGTFDDPEAQGTTFTMPASDVTVTATYEEQVTVTYLANDGSGGSEAYQVFPGPYKLGYGFAYSDDGIFLGWAMGSPEGTIYQPGDTVEITGDTTFYALWAQPEDYVIVGGQMLRYQDEPVYAVTDADGQVTLAPELGEDDNWNIKWDGRTLTLRNAHVADEISSPFGWEQDCAIGICKVRQGTTILMEGENVISCKGKPGQYSVQGIYRGYEYSTDEALTIQNKGNTTILWEGEADYTAIQSTGSPVYLKNEGTLSIQSASESGAQTAFHVESPLTIENNHELNIFGPFSGIAAAAVTWTGSGSAQMGTSSQPCVDGIYAPAFEMNSGELAIHAQGNAIAVWNLDGKLEVNGGTLTATGGLNGGDGSGIYSIPNASFNGGVITAGSSCPTGYGIYIDSYLSSQSALISSSATITARAVSEGGRAFSGTVTALPQDHASLLFWWGADADSAHPIQVTEQTELSLYEQSSMGYFHCESRLALYPYQAKYVYNKLDYDGIYWCFERDDARITNVRNNYDLSSYFNYKNAVLIDRSVISYPAGSGRELEFVLQMEGDLYDTVRRIWFPTDTISGMLFFCPAMEHTSIGQLKIDDTVLTSQAYEVRGDALVISQDCFQGLAEGKHVIQCILADGRSFQSILTIPPTHIITLACEPAEAGIITLTCNQKINSIDLAIENRFLAETGTSITVSAVPMSDYRSAGWKLDGEIVSTDAQYSFIVNKDTSLTMVLEDNIADSVTVGGKTMEADGGPSYATTDDSGAVTLQPNYTEADHWNLKFEAGTLTLRNAVIRSSPDGIYSQYNLTIVLEDENVVAGADDADADGSYGIRCEGKLVLEGSGTASLAASGGLAEYESVGIYADAGLSVSGCTVAAAGRDGAIKRAAIYTRAPVFVLGTDERPVSVKVGADAASAVELDGSPFTGTTDIQNSIYYNPVYVYIGPHVHNYSNWQHSETQHWGMCICGEKGQASSHIAGGWSAVIEPTETTEGLRHKVCTVCGYEMKAEAIPPLVVLRDVSASGVQLTLSNQTAGVCLAALYDSSSRLLTAGFLNIAAGAGDISISFPVFSGTPVCVKFFFLDQSYTPIYRCVTGSYVPTEP